MKNNLIKQIIDWSFIIINVTFSLSIIGVLIFDRLPISAIISVLILDIFLYIIRWKTSFSFLPRIQFSALLIVFFLIYCIDIIQNILIDATWALARLILLFIVLIFLEYLYSLYKKSNDIDGLNTVLKPYCAYSLYNVIIVLVTGFLVLANIINPQTNELSNNSLMADNIEHGQIVYWPYHLSVAVNSSRLLAAFGIPVTFTGLSHEPHVLNFLILPSLFFIRASNSIKPLTYWLIILAYVVSLFFSFSTTAYGALLLVFFINIIWYIFIKRKRNYVFILIVSFFLLYWINNLIDISSLLQEELSRKTVNQTGSLEYSGSMLKYIVSPESLLGYGNMPHPGNLSSQNIGLLTSILDVLFYIILVLSSLKLVFSKDEKKHFIGLGCLYIAIHMLKVNILAFNYPYLAFVVFILYISLDKKRKKNGEFALQ